MNFAKTAYLEKKLLDQVLLGEAFTPPAVVYLALFTADPGRSGSLANEIADPAYERQEIAFTAADDDETSGSYSENAYDIEFPQAATNWGTVTHAAIMDAATGGNMLYVVELDAAKEITIEDFLKFPAGTFVVKED